MVEKQWRIDTFEKTTELHALVQSQHTLINKNSAETKNRLMINTLLVSNLANASAKIYDASYFFRRGGSNKILFSHLYIREHQLSHNFMVFWWTS